MINKTIKVNYIIEGIERHITGELKEENEHYIIIIGNKNNKEYRIYHSSISLIKEVIE